MDSKSKSNYGNNLLLNISSDENIKESENENENIKIETEIDHNLENPEITSKEDFNKIIDEKKKLSNINSILIF